jgi:hypothetical protein
MRNGNVNKRKGNLLSMPDPKEIRLTAYDDEVDMLVCETWREFICLTNAFDDQIMFRKEHLSKVIQALRHLQP